MDRQEFDLIVIGGGAAGFFAAMQAAQRTPSLKILIIEKSNKLLSKVKVSGGGRCNVTHNNFSPIELASHYPRGGKPLAKLFRDFQARDMVQWLADRGVEVHAEEDGRIFPRTNSSQTIIACFMNEVIARKIGIEMGAGVQTLIRDHEGLSIKTTEGSNYLASAVLVATGGNSNPSFYDWIRNLGHTIKKPIPSLFTFNDAEKKFSDLMGVTVKNATVRIGGTRFEQTGPVLITHWGLSGPAVIRLSAWAAAYLNQVNYEYTVFVNWTGTYSEEAMRQFLSEHQKTKGKQNVIRNPLFAIPARLWERLCSLSEIKEEKVWGELAKRNQNKLLEFLIRCPFYMKGKTTYKEEFVTCGGVDLAEINLGTMESRVVEGLYFAGEVLDIDGETGGFNFQAAWTTAYVAARSISEKFSGGSPPLNS